MEQLNDWRLDLNITRNDDSVMFCEDSRLHYASLQGKSLKQLIRSKKKVIALIASRWQRWSDLVTFSRSLVLSGVITRDKLDDIYLKLEKYYSANDADFTVNDKEAIRNATTYFNILVEGLFNETK